MYEWSTQKGYMASVAPSKPLQAPLGRVSCTAFLIDCIDRRLLQKTGAHLNRLGALKDMLQGQEQDILTMLGSVNFKPGKGPRKPIYIVDEAALKEGEGEASGVSLDGWLGEWRN